MVKDKKQKDISINDLAVMMNNRFDGIDKQLQRMEVKTDMTLEYVVNIDKELSKLQKDVERKETSYVTKSALRKIVGRG